MTLCGPKTTRRDFLRQAAGTLGMLGGAAFASRRLVAQSSRPDSQRPNVVLIMADDMGFCDIGCYGGEVRTPNLDRLAAGGLRFTQFYNTARCCPTRASLLTGLYSHQAGVGHMVGNYGRPGYQGYLNDRCVTIGEAMKLAGYRTLMAGKWHVGSQKEAWPRQRGFDRFYGTPQGGGHYYKMLPGRDLVLDDQVIPPPQGWYATDAFTDYAIRFVQEAHALKKPFFLYVAHIAPHWPLHALGEDIDRYRGKYDCGWDELRLRRHKRMIELGIVDAKWPLTPRDHSAKPWDQVPNKEGQALRMSVYAAQIDRMDQNVGRLTARLKDLGIADNTLVMFLSDNGGCAEAINRQKGEPTLGGPESYLSYGLPWANASNTPFRLYKHWVHEGGISTPLIAYWPAVIRTGGKLTNQVGHVIDLMATCLDVAGGEYPKTYNGKPVTPLEGKSLVPIFQGKTRPGHEAVFWEHEGNRAVRKGNWKLVSRYPAPWELYDLEADRTELSNLAAKHPDQVRELTELYDRWAERSNVVPWGDARKKPKESKKPASKSKTQPAPAKAQPAG